MPCACLSGYLTGDVLAEESCGCGGPVACSFPPHLASQTPPPLKHQPLAGSQDGGWQEEGEGQEAGRCHAGLRLWHQLCTAGAARVGNPAELASMRGYLAGLGLRLAREPGLPLPLDGLRVGSAQSPSVRH